MGWGLVGGHYIIVSAALSPRGWGVSISLCVCLSVSLSLTCDLSLVCITDMVPSATK